MATLSIKAVVIYKSNNWVFAQSGALQYNTDDLGIFVYVEHIVPGSIQPAYVRDFMARNSGSVSVDPSLPNWQCETLEAFLSGM